MKKLLHLFRSILCCAAFLPCSLLTHAEDAARQQKPVPDPFIADGAAGHFTWGVDVASGVDLTARDMTMLHIGGAFGYKGGIMQFAGVGASIISMMNNSSRCYPVYAIARTSFCRRYQPCFLEVKAGISFNSILERPNSSDPYGSVGVGFNLAHSRNFNSYILLSAIIQPVKSYDTPDAHMPGFTVAYASIGIGCSF